MKFCPECSSGVDIGSVKFCHNCGKNLWQTISNNTTTSLSSPEFSLNNNNSIYQDIVKEKEEMKIENGQEDYTTIIYDLGVKLEELVEKILKNKDYSTQRRLKLRGKSGALHEIDIFAKRKNKVMAVECKNYERNSVVGVKEIRDFHSKLNDLHHNEESLFVTYGRFSADSRTYADKYDIELWDGDTLSKIYLSMLIGRYAPPPSSDYNEITIDAAALPLSMSYEEISNLKLVNPSITKITGLLLFCPYYIFEYKLDCIKIDRKGKTHRIHDEDYCIVDVITEHVLYEDEQDELSNLEQMFFSKKSKDESQFEDALKKREHSQICIDLKNIKPKIQYKVKESPDYSINILKPDLYIKTATYIILEKIIETNIKEVSYDFKTSKGEVEKKTMTIIPKKSDIIIKKSSLIYVPIWTIGIQSKDITYRRRAMAASNTMIVDEIALCHKDFSSLKIWNKKRYTNALCEICGVSLCADHIYKNNEKYFCKDHSR